MSIDPRTPCIIGVARRTWHPDDVGPEGAPEPLDMWEHVGRAAAEDAGRPDLVREVEGINIVYCQTWQYDDAVARLADRLDADPKQRFYSGIGGTMGQQLLDAIAERMLAGEQSLAMITSAEALATQRAYKKRGERAAYSYKPHERRPFPWESPPDPIEVAHDVFQAWLTFAVFENARRGRRGDALESYRRGIAEMCSPMTKIAAANPDAWYRTERSVDDLVTVRPDNRLVGYPYTKYVVAVMDVDMAAAVVVATHERADALGIPADRRVYLRGYCYATDPVLVAARPEMWRSPAMHAVATTALAGARIGIDDVAHLDLYSCFGSSLHFACDALGISPLDDRGLTVTGGLPYHGGPGSGYLVHAIAKIVDVLRSDPGAYGMVSGVGMHMTKHVYGVYSTAPGVLSPPAGIQAGLDAHHDIEVIAEHDGDATVVAYSIVHDRSGDPEWGLLVCDLGDRRRTYARLDDRAACAAAETDELVGRKVTLTSVSRTGPAGEVRTNLAQV